MEESLKTDDSTVLLNYIYKIIGNSKHDSVEFIHDAINTSPYAAWVFYNQIIGLGHTFPKNIKEIIKKKCWEDDKCVIDWVFIVEKNIECAREAEKRLINSVYLDLLLKEFPELSLNLYE